MHEEEPRLLRQHMAVQGRDRELVLFERGNDGIDIVGSEPAVATRPPPASIQSENRFGPIRLAIARRQPGGAGMFGDGLRDMIAE